MKYMNNQMVSSSIGQAANTGNGSWGLLLNRALFFMQR